MTTMVLWIAILVLVVDEQTDSMHMKPNDRGNENGSSLLRLLYGVLDIMYMYESCCLSWKARITQDFDTLDDEVAIRYQGSQRVVTSSAGLYCMFWSHVGIFYVCFLWRLDDGRDGRSFL